MIGCINRAGNVGVVTTWGQVRHASTKLHRDLIFIDDGQQHG